MCRNRRPSISNIKITTTIDDVKIEYLERKLPGVDKYGLYKGKLKCLYQ